MRISILTGIASLLQLHTTVYALPTEQQPLQAIGSPDVLAVQAA